MLNDNTPSEHHNNIPVELASRRKIRERHTVGYRLAHWPIWILVCYIIPGAPIFDLERGFGLWTVVWLGVVVAATGVAGLRGRLPGVEPRPYLIHFAEDKPNPVYRQVCYTLAWSEIVAFTLLNLSHLGVAIMTGGWYLRQVYDIAYFPLVATIWILGAVGMLPRVKRSTRDEARERRYFYGVLWAAGLAHLVLGLLWAVLPPRGGSAAKLIAFLAVLAGAGWMAYRGMLPRTRPIVPGELTVSDGACVPPVRRPATALEPASDAAPSTRRPGHRLRRNGGGSRRRVEN